MAARLPVVPADQDEFIDMEITSFPNSLLFHASSTSPNPNSPSQFEFQMSTSSSSSTFQHSSGGASSTFPADELFYKGKLLPLHLPPRLQMLQNILHNEHNHSLPVTSGSANQSQSDNNQQKDLMTSYSTPITATPFESCNVSSYEMLNPDEEKEYDFVDVAEKNQKKKKMKRKQYFSLVSKLRAWFGKVSCKYELSYVTKKVADEVSASKARESHNLNHNKQMNGKVVGKKLYPFGQMIQRSDRDRFGSISSRIEFRSIDIDTDLDGGIIRSSSSVANSNKSCFNGSSSFSGLRSKSLYQELEIGNLVMGAIAHCKQSQLIN